MRAPARPRTRGDCVDGPRPCPYWSCRYHLGIRQVTSRGELVLSHPELDPHELTESCALDVAARGPATLQEIADPLGVTRERVRQLERRALAKLKWRLEHWADHETEAGERELPAWVRAVVAAVPVDDGEGRAA